MVKMVKFYMIHIYNNLKKFLMAKSQLGPRSTDHKPRVPPTHPPGLYW